VLARKKRMGGERAEGNGECVFRYFVRCCFYFLFYFYLIVRSFVLTLFIFR